MRSAVLKGKACGGLVRHRLYHGSARTVWLAQGRLIHRLESVDESCTLHV